MINCQVNVELILSYVHTVLLIHIVHEEGQTKAQPLLHFQLICILVHLITVLIVSTFYTQLQFICELSFVVVKKTGSSGCVFLGQTIAMPIQANLFDPGHCYTLQDILKKGNQ